MLFHPKYVPMIVAGSKKVTRRVWKRNLVKAGGIYQCKTRMFDSRWFAKIRVTRVWMQKLGEITETEAIADGHSSLDEFKESWMKFYGKWNPEQEMTVIEFEVVETNPDWQSFTV
jgi:hypothetical protein